jgi:hypothetical protein
VRLGWPFLFAWSLACTRTGLLPAPDAGAAGDAGACLAQATAVYDTVPLVRRADGTVWVAADRARFTEILGPAGHLHATDIAASGSTAYGTAIGCAIVEAGGVLCFPLAGPLIDSTDLGAGLGAVTTTSAVEVTSFTTPRGPLRGARQLTATMNGGGAAFCAVTDAGAIFCWGYGLDGILGGGVAQDSAFASPVVAGPAGDPLADAAEVRLGFDSTCARKTDGSVWCWGSDALGEVGVPDAGTDDPLYPAGPIALPGRAVRLAANPGHTHCAIIEDASVACWGWNAYAQAGADPAVASAPPTTILTSANGPALTGVVDLAPDRGMQAMCAVTGAGALFCWGHPFPPAGAADATSPYPVEIPLPQASGAPLRLPLSSYGGRDGSLVYIDPNGKLTLGAGGLPFAAQPPCD